MAATISNMPSHVDSMVQRGSPVTGATTQLEMGVLPGPEDVAVYLQILKLKEEVLSGRHARLKPSRSLMPSSSDIPSTSSTAAGEAGAFVQPGSAVSNAVVSSSAYTNGHQAVQILSPAYNSSFHTNNQLMHPQTGSPVTSSGAGRQSLSGAFNAASTMKPPLFNPSLLQKAPELVDAELRFARLRIESELEDQVAREKREHAQSVSKQDTLPDFDVYEVLSYAQEFEVSSLAKFAVPLATQNTDPSATHAGADHAIRPDAASMTANAVDLSSKNRASPSESDPSRMYSSQNSDELEEGEERVDSKIGTKPCKYFFQGRCFKKDDCKFSHDPAFAHQMSSTDLLTGRADRSGAQPPSGFDQTTDFRQRPSLDNIDTGAFMPSGVNAEPVAGASRQQSSRVPPPRQWQDAPATEPRGYLARKHSLQSRNQAPAGSSSEQLRFPNQHTFPDGETYSVVVPGLPNLTVSAPRAIAQQSAHNSNPSLPKTPRSAGISNPRKRPRASSIGGPSNLTTSPNTYIKAEPTSPPPLSALNAQSNNVSSDDDSQILQRNPRERLPTAGQVRMSRSNEMLHPGAAESPIVRQPLRRVLSDGRRPVETRREPDLRRVATTRYAARPAGQRRVVYVDELPRSERAGSVVYVESRAPHRQAVYEIDDGMEEVQYEDDLVYSEPRVIRRSANPSRTMDRVVVGKDGQRYIERIVDDEPDYQPAKVRRVETVVDSRGRVMSVVPASEGRSRTIRAQTGLPSDVVTQEDRARMAMPPPAIRSARPATRNSYQVPSSEQRVVVREQTDGLRRRHTSVVPRRIIYEHEVYDDDEDMGEEQGPPVEEVRYVRRVASVMPERRVRQRTIMVEEPYDRVSPEQAGYAYYADEGDGGYVVEGERDL